MAIAIAARVPTGIHDGWVVPRDTHSSLSFKTVAKTMAVTRLTLSDSTPEGNDGDEGWGLACDF